MATKRKISEFTASTSTTGLVTLGVNAQNESVKVPLGAILHGTSDNCTYQDSFRLLAEIQDNLGEEGTKQLNDALDSLCGLPPEGHTKYGMYRIFFGGSLIEVISYPITFARDEWMQVLRGRAEIHPDNDKKVKKSGDYNVLIRRRVNNTWQSWTKASLPESTISSIINKWAQVEEVAASYNRTVLDLGEVSSVDVALQRASEQDVRDNRDLREIRWRTGGDGGSIFISRWGGWYSTQYLFFHGQNRVPMARMVTGGGAPEVGEWKELILPTGIEFQQNAQATTLKAVFQGLNSRGNKEVSLPIASKTAIGMMTPEQVKALDKSDSSVLDLGEVASTEAVFNAAAEQGVIDNKKLREIRWRTSEDGGTIFISRQGGDVSTQFVFFHGDRHEPMVRVITGGSNMEIGEWETFLLPTDVKFEEIRTTTTHSILQFYAVGGRRAKTVTVPYATDKSAGFMTPLQAESLGKLETVLDLGEVSSVDAALNAAAEQSVIDNKVLREIHWRTSGDGGTIFISRWGGHYSTQFVFFHGQNRLPMARMITGGGSPSVGAWKDLMLPTAVEFEQVSSNGTATGVQMLLRGMNDRGNKRVSLPSASANKAGLMSSADYQRLHSLQSGYAELDATKTFKTGKSFFEGKYIVCNTPAKIINDVTLYSFYEPTMAFSDMPTGSLYLCLIDMQNNTIIAHSADSYMIPNNGSGAYITWHFEGGCSAGDNLAIGFSAVSDSNDTGSLSPIFVGYGDSPSVQNPIYGVDISGTQYNEMVPALAINAEKLLRIIDIDLG